jgi:uncharacterized membrane protein
VQGVRQDPSVEDYGTSRLEAFSDGVFAIAITLLILEVRVPRDVPLGEGLLEIWPSYLAYVTSFLTIGVIWFNHDAILRLVRRADRTLLSLNTLLLMVVAFIPFPTRLVAEYLREGGADERYAALAYGCTFVLLAIVFNLWWRWISHGRRLIRGDVPQRDVAAINRTFNPGIPSYAIVTALAFLSPLVSVALSLALAMFYGLPPTLYARRRAGV